MVDEACRTLLTLVIADMDFVLEVADYEPVWYS